MARAHRARMLRSPVRVRGASRGVLLGVCLARLATAEPTAEPAPALLRLTLHQALEFARQHQPSLRAAQARVEVAREEAAVPRAGWLPRAGATAQLLEGTANNTTGSYLTTSALDIPRIGGTPANAPSTWGPAASSFVGVGLRQELFDFGRLTLETAAQDLLTRAAEEQANLQRLDLDLAVEESYFAVQAAKTVARAAEAALVRARAHRELAAAGVRAGLRSPIELTRSEADLARFEVGRLRAAGAVTSSQSQLSAVLGSDAPLVDVADEELPSVPVPPIEEVLPQLASSDPAIREARARLEAQQRASEALDARLRPELSLSAGLNSRAGGTPVAGRDTPAGHGFLPDVPNWDVGVILSWSFLDPVTGAKAESSRRQEAVRRAELDGISQRDRAMLQRSYVSFQVAQSALPALERALEAARANQAQAEARFRAGLGTSVELADAEALLTEAEIQRAIGQFEQSRTRAQLGRAVSEATP